MRSTRQTQEYATESRQETRGMQYHWQKFKNNAWGDPPCVGGPGIMNNDFYGNGKDDMQTWWKQATQYAFAMR